MEVAWEGEAGGGRGPLVTYRLQCYRHEAFVHEAVSSLLAQTYRPLEILITDDASPDQTFEIAAAVARAYRGPHRVILYRSERNRDILEHCNEALHLIRGKFFLWLSGDDVAEPDQTEQLVAAWLEGGVSGVWSNYHRIDEHGRHLGLGLSPTHHYKLDLCDYAEGRFLDLMYGGVCGYTREVLDRFGPVPAQLGARGLESHFAFRAAILGPKRYLPQPLIKRRYHPNRATAGENIRDRQDDPMVVHERQIRVRLQILTGCRDVIANLDGTARDPSHEAVAQALTLQIANEARRLLEFEAFRARHRRAAESDGATAEHSGWRYAPNGLTLVRELPEYQYNLVAAECKYFAVPWRVGQVEPCRLRNHAYPGVLSAWTERELLAELSGLS